MEFGQLIEYNSTNFFLQKSYRKWGRDTSSRPLVFQKSFILGKSKRFAAWFQYIVIALKLACNKNKLYKTFSYWSRDVNFDFLEKDLELDSSSHFVYILTKTFLMLYSINWQNFFVWLPLLLEILGNMCIAIICFPGCDVIN